MREIELKLTLAEADIRALSKSPAFLELTGGKATTERLRSIYFDTADAALSRAKIALRIRHAGDRKRQTVKLDGRLSKGLSQSLEYEHEVTDDVPDLSLIGDQKVVSRIEKELAGRQPMPLFETRIDRTSAIIEIEGEGSVEIAIDLGDVCAGEKSAPLDEVELELKSGAPYGMLGVAEKLFRNVSINPSKMNKARRGFALIGLGEGEEMPRAAFSKRAKIGRNMTRVGALRSVGTAAAEQIVQNWEFMRVSSAPEGPHQLRVGLRRLRTALHVLKAKKLGNEFQAMEKSAQHLASLVGDLRDADVLLCDIYDPAAGHLEGVPGTGPLRELLRAHITDQRESVRQSLQRADWTEFKLHCLFFDFLMDRAIARAGDKFREPKLSKLANKALAKAWRRVAKWGERIDELTTEERHSLRKKLKSLRYTIEFFLPLYPAKEAKPFLKKLQQLQDIFGYLNDVASSEQLFEIIRKSGREDLMPTALAIHNWHLGRADVAWKDAQKRWIKLSATPRFWEY
jgi:inorganic triphosphatase YgiF